MNEFEEGKSYSFPMGYLTVERILDQDLEGPTRVQAFLHLNHAPGTLILTSPLLVDPARGEYVNTPVGRCYASEHKWPDLPQGMPQDLPEDSLLRPRSGYKVSHLLAEYGMMGMLQFKIPVKHAEFIRRLLDKADEVI